MVSKSSIPAFQREYAATLAARLKEPRRLLHVVAGPRQVGKTTSSVRTGSRWRTFYRSPSSTGWEHEADRTSHFTESVVEQAALIWLESSGWPVTHGIVIAPGEPGAERIDDQVEFGVSG